MWETETKGAHYVRYNCCEDLIKECNIPLLRMGGVDRSTIKTTRTGRTLNVEVPPHGLRSIITFKE